MTPGAIIIAVLEAVLKPGLLNTHFDMILAMSKGGHITPPVSVLTFLTIWNAFFVPLVFTFSRPDLRTLAVGMLAFRGGHSTDWSGLSAAATLSLLPIVILFFFLQRYFMEGITGAVKS